MLGTGLDFDPRTTDASKALVGRLFTPTQIFSAYRDAREKLGTGDLVLTVSEQDPSGFQADTRAVYIKKAVMVLGAKPMPIFMRGLVQQSAQGVMSLPFESDAMWFIVVRGPQDVPVMCVLYATPYEVSDTADTAAVN